jgi:hypothetical protein
MKRILSIIGCVIVLAASSCTKKYITPNPNITVYYDLPSSAWKLSTDGKSYYATISIKEIGPDFNHFGGLIVSIWDVTFNPNDEVYEQVPEVFGGTSFSYTTNADGNNPGNVTLYAQSPDGNSPVQPSDNFKVKILLVDSN